MQLQQDEVLKLAKQAQVHEELCGEHFIYEFAKLVAAKEREACAKICEDFADVNTYPDGIIQDYHAHLIRLRGEA